MSPVAIKPVALQPRQAVGVFAPASPGASIFPERFQRAVAALSDALACEVVVPPGFERNTGLTAGTGAQRAADLRFLLEHPRVGAVFTTYGGFNSLDMLPHLSFLNPAAPPKILTGYSDTTALLLAYHALTGAVVYYGPALLPQFGEFPRPLEFTVAALRDVICAGKSGDVGRPLSWTADSADWTGPPLKRRLVPDSGPRVLRAGFAEGILWGGNLSTLNYLAGTGFWRPPAGPLILALEFTGEDARPGVVGRSLTHLRLTGLLDQVRGVLVGRCDADVVTRGTTPEDVIVTAFGPTVPIIADMPFGHTDPMVTLPLGTRAEIRADGSDGSGLFLCESPVSMHRRPGA